MHRVYLWTEADGVRYPPLAPARPANYVSALAFSSTSGGKSILAVARNSGHVSLWSLFEQKARFEIPHPWAACSVAWRPVTAARLMPGEGAAVECEDLLIGDDSGTIYYYSVFWSDSGPGHTVLLTKLDAHAQNICGLAWSPDGETFISGGNDNSALLFYVSDVLEESSQPKIASAPHKAERSDDLTSEVIEACQNASLNALNSGIVTDDSMHIAGTDPSISSFSIIDSAIMAVPTLTPPHSPDHQNRGRPSLRASQVVERLPPSPISPVRFSFCGGSNLENALASPGIAGRQLVHRKSFFHSAAVKAIAFAPWQATLVATGGGSNDRQIHFYHTESGSTLAVINVFAQVTSLVWSSTKREIVATFGYAQPEHDVRVAVFSWPSCECVVSIPWERKANGEIGRALWAIPYPGGPNSVTTTSRKERDVGYQSQEAVRARDAAQDRGRLQSSARETNSFSRSPRSPGRMRTLGDPAHATSDSSRSEGETWASRTEEEGSLIIACCDQTVKFFEVWAGKSKGRSRGIGSKAGVLGGSKVLEGWCSGVSVDEVDETDSIR